MPLRSRWRGPRRLGVAPAAAPGRVLVGWRIRLFPLSLPGLTRQSTLAPTRALQMNARVKPGHDKQRVHPVCVCALALVATIGLGCLTLPSVRAADRSPATAADLAVRLGAALGTGPTFDAPYWMEAPLWQQLCPTLICGPSGGGLHAVDEWVDLRQVRALTSALIEVLSSWRPDAD